MELLPWPALVAEKAPSGSGPVHRELGDLSLSRRLKSKSRVWK